MGWRSRSPDEGIYRGDPQSIYSPPGSAQPGMTNPPPNVVPGQMPGLLPEPTRPPGSAGMARRAALSVLLVGAIGGGGYLATRTLRDSSSTDPSTDLDPELDPNQFPELDPFPGSTAATTRRSTSVTRSSSGSTRQVSTGSAGSALLVTHDGARYRIRLSRPRRQKAARWGDVGRPKNTYLIVDAEIQRVDSAATATVGIHWSDWSGTAGKVTARAELIGDGWGSSALSTISLKSGQKVSGALVFDLPAGATTVRLMSREDVAEAAWTLGSPVAVTAPPVAAIGTTVTSQVAAIPFTVAVRSATWIPNSDPRLRGLADNGYLLLLEVVCTWRKDSLWLTDGDLGQSQIWPRLWRFRPTGGKAENFTGSNSDGRAISTIVVSRSAPEKALVGFDSTGAGGVLELRDEAGAVVMQWRIPGPA